MSIASKICGVSDCTAINAAVDGGAAYVGFVFPRSPRNVTPEQAAELIALMPDDVEAVALAVDPDDALVDAVGAIAGLTMFQLHGSERPNRVKEIKTRTGRRVIKAIKVSNAADLAVADAYFDAADMLLFDAATPADMKNALPGGNAVSFDWNILAGQDWPLPWMLLRRARSRQCRRSDSTRCTRGGRIVWRGKRTGHQGSGSYSSVPGCREKCPVKR